MNRHRVPQLALAVALLVAGCSSDGSTPQAGGTTPPASGNPTTSGTPGASGTPATPGPGGTASVRPSGSPDATATGGPNATGVPGTPRPGGSTPAGEPTMGPTGVPVGSHGAIPTNGRYPASQRGSERFGPKGGAQQTRTFPGSITVEVRAGSNADERELFVPYSNDRTDLVRLTFADDEVKLIRIDSELRYTNFFGNRVFLAVPPVPLCPRSAPVGHQFSGTFGGTGDGSFAGKVLRTERLTIGGVGVNTVVIDLVVNYKADFTSRSHTITWWDPSRGLAVKQQLTSDATQNAVTYHQETTVTLTRLTPS